jgi:hypothetical protein
VALKGVRSGVERRRGVSGLKPGDHGRRDAPGEVLKDRRSHRERGRMGTSARDETRRRGGVRGRRSLAFERQASREGTESKAKRTGSSAERHAAGRSRSP